ncbi:MAG TPA: hypothetical protein VGK27_06170 [Candidatus Deferrimicrobiaceae bacterium]
MELRADNTAKGIELIENLGDLELSDMGVHRDIFMLGNDAEVYSNIRSAKEYRNKFVAHKVNKSL